MSDHVLVKLIKEEQQTSGGVYLPSCSDKSFKRGEVVAVGRGKLGSDGKRIPLEIKQGDSVFFSKFAGTTLEDDHLIIRENEFLGIVENG